MTTKPGRATATTTSAGICTSLTTPSTYAAGTTTCDTASPVITAISARTYITGSATATAIKFTIQPAITATVLYGSSRTRRLTPLANSATCGYNKLHEPFDSSVNPILSNICDTPNRAKKYIPRSYRHCVVVSNGPCTATWATVCSEPICTTSTAAPALHMNGSDTCRYDKVVITCGVKSYSTHDNPQRLHYARLLQV